MKQNDNLQLVSLVQQGDKCAEETLIRQNAPLVWSMVKRFQGRGQEPEDLFQLGCIGLLRAAQRFDFSKNVQFSTYAVYMIIGEIKRFLRDDGLLKVSRSVKELAVKAKAVQDVIEKETGREAKMTEIAQRLGIDTEELAAVYTASKPPESLDAAAFEGKDGGQVSLLDTLPDDSTFDEEVVNSVTLREAMKTLEERDRKILLMRFYQNKTQSEVSAMLGISQVQVSRLEKKLLRQLRDHMIS